METNALPRYDMSINTTGCCPKFNPEGWDGQDLHFRDKRFVRATTHSVAHVPIDMSRVFGRVNENIQEDGAFDPNDFIVLSHDTSPWKGEHLFSVSRDVPEEEMTTVSGDFVTKVFEGDYAEAKDWDGELRAISKAHGKEGGRVFFFYTTCPKCAKAYGQNYVVGLVEV